MTDLDDLIEPAPRVVSIRGAEIEVLPLKIRQMPGFSRAITPALSLILSGNWLQALEAHGDAMQQGIAIALGKPLDWVGDLYPDDFLRLGEAVLEVNLDFFAQTTLPVAAQVKGRLVELMQRRPDTATSSPSLSGTGIPPQTH